MNISLFPILNRENIFDFNHTALENSTEELLRYYEENYSDLLETCRSTLDLDREMVESATFWCVKVGVLSIGSLGLLGNIISFVTIVSMAQRNLFYNLLLALAVYDTIFILASGLVNVNSHFSTSKLPRFAAEVITRLVIPLAGSSLTGSTYTCVGISLERYLGICRANSCVNVRKFYHYLGLIVAVNVAIDAVRFFEFEPEKNKLPIDFYTEDSEEMEEETFHIFYTKLRQNETYVLCIMWLRLILTSLVPLFLIILLNLRIFCFYKANRKRISQATNGGHGRLTSTLSERKRGQEHALFLLFFSVATTFLVCQIPRIFLNLYEIYLSGKRRQCRAKFGIYFNPPTWVMLIGCLEAPLLTFNSSINFVFYCWLGRDFRQHMMKTLFQACLQKRGRGSEESRDTSTRSAQSASGVQSRKHSETEAGTPQKRDEEAHGVKDMENSQPPESKTSMGSERHWKESWSVKAAETPKPYLKD